MRVFIWKVIPKSWVGGEGCETRKGRKPAQGMPEAASTVGSRARAQCGLLGDLTERASGVLPNGQKAGATCPPAPTHSSWGCWSEPLPGTGHVVSAARGSPRLRAEGHTDFSSGLDRPVPRPKVHQGLTAMFPLSN